MKKLIFLNSHPIQYFAPLYNFLNRVGIDCSLWYCSQESLKLNRDIQFGVDIKWDIPLLDGYKSKFFKNFAPKPSIFNGFFGLMNFGIIPELFKTRNSVIIVHGYHYFTHFLVLLLGRFSGNEICLRIETPQNQEDQKSGFLFRIRRIVLKTIIFSGVDTFLYIGTQNKRFYQNFGINDERLVFCPYSVDNDRFSQSYSELKACKNDLKMKNGINSFDKVILYSGKYIDKKRPMDLLEAFHIMNDPNAWLVMVGEGILRGNLEQYIQANNIKNVLLTGFINQSKISEYYAIADVFVMCSGNGETWGLSTNEAMNFNLPLIISDRTGCSEDLVKEGINGYTFPLGNISELANKLKLVLHNNALSNQISSRDIIKDYSYSTIANNLKELLKININ